MFGHIEGSRSAATRVNTRVSNDNAMRVLVLSHDCGAGGAEESLMDLLAGLDRKIFKPIIVMPCDGPLRQRVADLGLAVHVYPLEQWIPYRRRKGWKHLNRLVFSASSRVRELAALIEVERIDLVYTNTITVLDGAVAARLTGTPHVWHARERYSGNQDLGRYVPGYVVRRVVLGMSKSVIVNSMSLGTHFGQAANPGKVVTVYNGVDIVRFRLAPEQRERLCRTLGIQPKTRLIGIVGSVSERKGHQTLIEALARLRGESWDVACLVVGRARPEQIALLLPILRNLEVESRVHFLGERSDVPEIMKSLDVLAVASHDEPFGRVIIEAMAAGTPVVSTRSGGPEEIIVDGETGFLVPVGDNEMMAACIAEILLDERLAGKFREEGLKRVSSRFSHERYVAGVADILERACH